MMEMLKGRWTSFYLCRNAPNKEYDIIEDNDNDTRTQLVDAHAFWKLDLISYTAMYWNEQY